MGKQIEKEDDSEKSNEEFNKAIGKKPSDTVTLDKGLDEDIYSSKDMNTKSTGDEK